MPDLRGFGHSGPTPDGFYDAAAYPRDVRALVSEELGHERCVTCGGDVGGVVALDLALRFEGFMARQLIFNTVLAKIDQPSTGALSKQPDGRDTLRRSTNSGL